MKKLWIIVACVFCIAGCSAKPETQKISVDNTDIATSGVWISYSELNGMLKSENGFKVEFQNAITNLKQLKIENVYLHVRSFCDSFYQSDYFPLMSAVQVYDYDVLEYAVSECHKNNIKLHAWINPYRVLTSSSDIEALDKNSPAYKWLSDEISENDRNVCVYNGIYLNPAELEVQKLVISGIKEILQRYEVDGIHFDDYFYPTCDPSFDKISYDEYIKDNPNPLELSVWRRNNVNSLISSCYNTIKSINKDVLFTVSPMASIEKNYDVLYADVNEWLKQGYLDYIIPQIYFGFEYPDEEFQFDNLLNDWKNVTKGSNVGLLIGLAPYKAKPELENDKEEWENNADIVSRQVKICKEDSLVEGYVYFSYSSLFSQESAFVKQRENIIKSEN